MNKPTDPTWEGVAAKSAADVAVMAVSADAALNPQAQSARCALATCSLPVSSANVLGITKAWEKRAIAHEEKSRDRNIFGGDEMRQIHWEIANAFRTCIRELRRQVEREIQRQPAENIKDQPTPGAVVGKHSDV